MCIYTNSTSQTNNNFKDIAASQNKGKQLTIGKCDNNEVVSHT